MKTKKQRIKDLESKVNKIIKELNRQISNINVLYQQIENIRQLEVATGNKVYELMKKLETIQFTTNFIKETTRKGKQQWKNKDK